MIGLSKSAIKQSQNKKVTIKDKLNRHKSKASELRGEERQPKAGAGPKCLAQTV